MVKINKKQRKVIGIFLAIAFFLIIILAFNQGILKFPLAIGVHSITLIDRISNDNDLNNAFFKVHTTIDGGSETIVAIIDSEEFNRNLYNYKTDFDLEIDAKLSNQEARYSILPNTNYLYQYSILQLPDSLWNTPSCPSNSLYTFNEIGTDVFCFVKEQKARFGNLQEPTVKTDVQITVKSGGQQVSKTISNFGSESGTISFQDSSGKTVVRTSTLTSSKALGANPPGYTNYKAYFIYGTNNWLLTTSSYYDSYIPQLSYYDSQYKISSLVSQKDEFNKCKGGIYQIYTGKLNECLNAKFNEMIVPITTAYNNIVSTQTNLGSINGGENNGIVTYNIQNLKIANVDIDFEVNAKWLGVKSIVAKPTINSIECKDFTQNGIIKVDVKGGDADSTYDVDLVNCGQIRQSSDVLQQSILANQISSFYLPIDTGIISEITETCQVKSYNVGKSDLYDIKTITCKSLPLGKCDVGEQIFKIVNNKKCIFECVNGDYPTEPNKDCCDFIEPILSSSPTHYQCSIKTPGNGTTGNETEKCNSCTQWALNIFKKPENKCEPTSFFGDGTWYNPLSWWKYIGSWTGLTDQKLLCPIFLTVMGIILFFFLILLLLLFGGIGLIVLIFAKIFSFFKRKRKRR